MSQKKDHVVFHCGTRMKENHFYTNGGRVMIIVALAEHLTKAAALATQAAGIVDFDGKQFRKDIAHKGIAKYIFRKVSLIFF